MSDFNNEEYLKFFDWLRGIDRLDEYEAMLDSSIEYSNQELCHRANSDIEKLKSEFRNKILT